MYSTALLASVVDKCLTYIVIQTTKINELFCGGNVNYITTVSSYDNETTLNGIVHNITGLNDNTSYSITIVASRGRERIDQANIPNEQTLQSLSKYA